MRPNAPYSFFFSTKFRPAIVQFSQLTDVIRLPTGEGGVCGWVTLAPNKGRIK